MVLRGDARRALGWQFQLELGEEELLDFVGSGVAVEDQGAAIRGRKVDVEHLDGRELFEHRAWGQSGSFQAQLVAQRGMDAEGQEGDEDMGFNALDALMKDGSQILSMVTCTNPSSSANGIGEGHLQRRGRF